MSPRMLRPILGVPLLLTACVSGGGGGGGGGSTPSATLISFTSITIKGTSNTACTVSAHGVADADGKADLAWNVPVPMDGTRLPTYRSDQPYEATVTATADHGGDVSVTVGIHP